MEVSTPVRRREIPDDCTPDTDASTISQVTYDLKPARATKTSTLTRKGVGFNILKRKSKKEVPKQTAVHDDELTFLERKVQLLEKEHELKQKIKNVERGIDDNSCVVPRQRFSFRMPQVLRSKRCFGCNTCNNNSYDYDNDEEFSYESRHGREERSFDCGFYRKMDDAFDYIEDGCTHILTDIKEELSRCHCDIMQLCTNSSEFDSPSVHQEEPTKYAALIKRSKSFLNRSQKSDMKTSNNDQDQEELPLATGEMAVQIDEREEKVIKDVVKTNQVAASHRVQEIPTESNNDKSDDLYHETKMTSDIEGTDYHQAYAKSFESEVLLNTNEDHVTKIETNGQKNDTPHNCESAKQSSTTEINDDHDTIGLDCYAIKSFPDNMSESNASRYINVTLTAIALSGLTVESKALNKKLSNEDNNILSESVHVILSVVTDTNTNECFLPTHLRSLPVVKDPVRGPILRKAMSGRFVKKHLLAMWENHDMDSVEVSANGIVDASVNHNAASISSVTFSRDVCPAKENHQDLKNAQSTGSKMMGYRTNHNVKNSCETNFIEIRVCIRNGSNGEVIPVGVAKVDIMTGEPRDLVISVPVIPDYHKSLADLSKKKYRELKSSQSKWNSFVSFVLEDDDELTFASFKGRKDEKIRLEPDAFLRVRLQITSKSEICLSRDSIVDGGFPSTNVLLPSNESSHDASQMSQKHQNETCRSEESKFSDSADHISNLEKTDEVIQNTVDDESIMNNGITFGLNKLNELGKNTMKILDLNGFISSEGTEDKFSDDVSQISFWSKSESSLQITSDKFMLDQEKSTIIQDLTIDNCSESLHQKITSSTPSVNETFPSQDMCAVDEKLPHIDTDQMDFKKNVCFEDVVNDSVEVNHDKDVVSFEESSNSVTTGHESKPAISLIGNGFLVDNASVELEPVMLLINEVDEMTISSENNHQDENKGISNQCDTPCKVFPIKEEEFDGIEYKLEDCETFVQVDFKSIDFQVEHAPIMKSHQPICNGVKPKKMFRRRRVYEF